NKSSANGASSGGSAAVVTPGPPPPGAALGAAPTIVEVATDNQYSVTKMAAPAGRPLTITVENKGAIHNIHVMGVMDDSSKVIMTPLQQGPNTFSVTFVISKPGNYTFQCDAHPTDMKGTLAIQ